MNRRDEECEDVARTRRAETDEFVDAVLIASRVLVGVSVRSLADVEDSVTLTQFRTLVVLSTRPGVTLTGLADVLDVNSSTALRMVDRLVAAGLATRSDNPANRREVLVGLTNTGAELVGRVTARRRREIARIVSKMPATPRVELARALHAFAAAAGEPSATGAVRTAYAW